MKKKKGNPVPPETAAPAGVTPDYWRQLDVFDPEHFKRPVHIIGVGATGSYIAHFLAKMGVKTMILWDFDKVEPHNPPNQVYGLEELGMLKVDACKKIFKRDCGIDVVAQVKEVDGTQPLSGIVYLCVDSMTARKAIWEKALKLNMDVDLVVETRLGAEFGWIHTVRPTNLTDIKGFETTLFSDGEAEEPACTYRAISTTVGAIASAAAHKTIKLEKSLDLNPVIKVEVSAKRSSGLEMLCINPIIMTACGWEGVGEKGA